MKATIKDIAPGKIFYSVIGVNYSRAKQAEVGEKLIVTSNVYRCSNIGELRFNCIEVFSDWENRKGHQYCTDRGMVEGQRIYNLNRLFCTLEEAEDFVNQCHTGVFKDPLDQEYYEKSKLEQPFDDLWWFS